MKSFKDTFKTLKESLEAGVAPAPTTVDQKDDGYRRTPEGHIITPSPIHFKHIDGVPYEGPDVTEFPEVDEPDFGEHGDTDGPAPLKAPIGLNGAPVDDGVKRTEDGHIIIQEPIHFKYPNG